jgi:hypothetical protein
VRGVSGERPAVDTKLVRSHSTLAAVVVVVTLLVGVAGAVWSIGSALQEYIADMRKPRTPANRAELLAIAQTQHPARLTFGSPDGGDIGRAESLLTFAANELERAAAEVFGRKPPTAAMQADAAARYTRNVNTWNRAVLTLWFAAGVSQDGPEWPVVDPPIPHANLSP